MVIAAPRVLLTLLPLFWPKMPPLGLGFLQSYLAQNGINSNILDLNNIFYNLADNNLKKQWLLSCNAALEKNILSIIKRNYPTAYNDSIEKMLCYDVLGFSCFKSNFASTLEIIRLLKAKRKDIKIILGGPEITRQFFKGKGRINSSIVKLADYLVVGEGEEPLLNFLISKKNSAKTASFKQLDNLENIDFPRYQGLSVESYPKKDAMPIQFSRGCIRRCGFCSERLLYKGLRHRRVKSIVDEIRYHKINNNTNYFVFFDSLINSSLDKLEDLCDKIIDNFGSINWEAQIAVRDDMSQKLLERMKRSGCYNLFVGLESASDNTLKKMNKGFTTKDAISFFKKLNKAGLFFGISIIVGYPGETDRDFRESLDFIIRNRDIIPKIEQVNPFAYYDGTPADKTGDYKVNRASLGRMQVFIDEIKRSRFKYTNAFLGNLIEKDDGV